MVNWRMVSGREEDVVISSRIRLARNLEHHRFTNAFDPKEAQDIQEQVIDSVNSTYPDEFQLVRLADVSMSEKQILMENQMISPELVKNSAYSAYQYSDQKKVNIMINEEDHIRLQVLMSGFDLGACYDEAQKVTGRLEEQLVFSFDDEFGYLTACPTNTGTGLRASVMVHIPAIVYSRQFKGLVDSLGKLGITVRGIHGEGSKGLGDLYQISNQRTLGMTEDEVIEKLNGIVARIIQNERHLRQVFVDSGKIYLEDQIYRALGTLKHARVMTLEEALSYLSYIRVGVASHIIANITLKEVTDLFFHVQKYMVMSMKPALPEDEQRAAYLRKALSEVK